VAAGKGTLAAVAGANIVDGLIGEFLAPAKAVSGWAVGRGLDLLASRLPELGDKTWAAALAVESYIAGCEGDHGSKGASSTSAR
jgi:hypothetical protein